MELLDDYILRAEGKSLILKENTAPYASNREFKDGMFRLLFSEKKAALELLNALEGTERKDEGKIEIDTLRGALYKRRQNDLAFRYDFSPLSVVEHMSTWSENMPLREAAYVFRVYEKIVPDRELYKEARFPLPIPRLYVLYNGTRDKPLETVQHLFGGVDPDPEGNGPMMEVAVKMININLHKNHPILDRSPTLKQYAQFIDRVRNHVKLERMDRDEAILASIESCVKDGILEDFLRKHGSEVINMLTGITLEELYEIREEEAEERGARRGAKEKEAAVKKAEAEAKAAKKAMEEKDRLYITKLLRKNWTVEEIQELTEVPMSKILQIQAALH